jgi:hypothetical protein
MENKLKKNKVKPKAVVRDTISQSDIDFVELWFSNNFNGRLTYKTLHPNVSNEVADASSSRLLRKVTVEDHIEIKRESIRKLEEIKMIDLVKTLKLIMSENTTEEYEVENSDGRVRTKTKTKSNSPAQIQAMNLLAKIGGLEAVKKIDITSKGESLVWNETKTYSK